jgi:hypothetical protein
MTKNVSVTNAASVSPPCHNRLPMNRNMMAGRVAPAPVSSGAASYSRVIHWLL